MINVLLSWVILCLINDIRIIICLIPFTIFLSRRTKFGWRVGIAVTAYVVCSFLTFLLFSFIEAAFVTDALRFIFMCFLSGALLFIPFKTNGWNVSSATACAIIVYNISNQFILLLQIFGVRPRVILGIVCDYGTCIILSVISYFIFRSHHKAETERRDFSLLIICAAVIIVSFIGYIATAIITVDSEAAENIRQVLFKYRIVLVFYSLISCCLCAFCLVEIFRRIESEGEKIKACEMLAEEQKKNETVARLQEELDIKVHDMKHILRLLDGGENICDRSREIESIKQTMLEYESYVDTGNSVLNAIVREKIIICNKSDIQFTCSADGKLLNFISSLDIVAIFGNMLDNAVNYLKTVEDKERRILSLVVREKLGKVYICAENYYAEESIELVDGLPVTRRDRLKHGFGCKSIRKATRKYNGDMFITIKDNKYILEIIFDCK